MANSHPTTTIVRLGRVLYWGCCIIAAIPALGVIFVLYATLHQPWMADTVIACIAFVILAVVIWLVGRGARYVLANE